MSFKRIAGLLIMLVAVTTACVREPHETHETIEQRSLRAWMEKYHPELLDNYQEEGGYYVEILAEPEDDGIEPISGKDVWVWFDITVRDLQGNIHETRKAEVAEQLATYTNYTHYVPAIRFSGKTEHTLMEGTYLAMYNPLKIGYISGQELDSNIEYQVGYGSKLRLYLPSSVTGTTSNTADGGYEGEFKMDESKPVIVDLTIYGHVENPVAYEGERIEGFAGVNGGLCTDHKVIKEEENKENQKSYIRRHATRTEESEEEEEEEIDTRPLEFFDGRWHQPVDTLEHLLVNYSYTPKTSIDFKNSIGIDTLKYPGENIYDAGKIYGNNQMSDVDRRINEALIARFGEGISKDKVLEADSLKAHSTAKIWYIGRFLDGFIFDTNIDEVKQIIYGEVASEGEALTFQTADPTENKYILAWNYSLPTLRYGQWAAILSSSTYAYGIKGKVGSHTTSSSVDSSAIDMASYYNMMNYMNNYYGNGYGGMYNNGYYGYNPYYYGYNYGYNPYPSAGTVTTTTTTSAEIPAYAPLLFQVFVENIEE